ncbi:MAG: hypothetical protein AMK72_01115 [Planctomycetes bacterium SM23_25]|jgi:predicted RNA-binding protein|nr:MAG: hypothetical protein AMK72_01115 [Planctomycetes bacterium SM23_25]
MCLARVEFIGDRESTDRQHLVDVAQIDLTPSGLKVVDLTGNVRQLAGEIQSIDFIESVVRIEGSKEPVEGTQ